MAFADRLRSASFRGVPFLMEQSEKDSGAAWVLHEFAKRDDNYHEPMGLKTKSFVVDAYVIGDDCISRADALDAACAEQSPGTFIHPWQGEQRVVNTGCRRKESTKKLRQIVFSLTFQVTGDQRYPLVEIDTAAVVGLRAESVLGTVQSSFIAAYTAAAMPAYLLSTASDLVGVGLAQLGTLTTSIVAVPEIASSFAREMLSVTAIVPTLVAAPAELAARVTGLMTMAASLPVDPRRAVGLMSDLSTFGDALPAAVDEAAFPGRAIVSQMAIVSLFRQSALAEAARAATSIDFDSIDEATRLRGSLTQRFDAEILRVGNFEPPPNVYFDTSEILPELMELRANTVRDITARSADRPRLLNFQANATLPIELLAYQLYGDARAATDILRRNPAIKHPGFVTGGRPLEVLSSFARAGAVR